MSIGNLTERFLYERLPEAIIQQDERGYMEALLSGYQDRLEDLRSYSKKLDAFWAPGELPDTPDNVVLVDLTSPVGVVYTRSLDLQATTPAADSSQLLAWAAAQLGLPRTEVSNVRYGYDALRAVDADVLSGLAATLGAWLYQTDLLAPDTRLRSAQVQLVKTWFPRLKFKGTVQSFEVLGRILGFDDVRVTPLWTRLSPRQPEDIGAAANDGDFNAAPEQFPQQQLNAFYDPFRYREGPFYSWTGTVSNAVTSTQFYTETVRGHNPWLDVVLLGSLAGTNVPTPSNGTVVHPATGVYTLSGGAPAVKATATCPGSSIQFQALAEGEDFNGLQVQVFNYGTQAVLTITDQLSFLKYRSSFFDLGLTADFERLEDVFGSRAATTNKDLKAVPALTSDGTAPSPYRPWVAGSIAVTQTVSDWVTANGTVSTVVQARRSAEPAAPYNDRQLNMDAVVAAGVQVAQAFEEVRAATRHPRRSQSGFLLEDSADYAVYPYTGTLFVTSGTAVYSGTDTGGRDQRHGQIAHLLHSASSSIKGRYEPFSRPARDTWTRSARRTSG